MLKSSRKALSLQLLSKHQERIKSMVSRIEGYKPTYSINKNYTKFRQGQIMKRIQQRQKSSDRLFEQNMKLIYKIQTTGPKIETKKFPEVKPNPIRAKSLIKSKTSRSYSSSNPKFRIKDVFRDEEQLFDENMKLITNIECTGPKVTCWVSKKTKKVSQIINMKKREEKQRILDKYKQISKEFAKLTKMKSFKRSTSISSVNSKSKLILS